MVRLARHSDRRGFTLLELVIVLAILVIVAGLASFPIRRFLDQQTLQGEVERIRVSWGKTRLEAMKTGRIYLFQFRPGEGTYRTQVWMSAEDELEGDLMTSAAASDELAAIEPPKPGPNSIEGVRQLPEGLHFAAAASEDHRAEVLTADEQSQGLDGWSPPIMFYPDGTTSTVRLLIADQENRVLQLDLRGLTGISRVSPANPEAEIVR